MRGSSSTLRTTALVRPMQMENSLCGRNRTQSYVRWIAIWIRLSLEDGMEKIATGGARAEREPASRIKSKEGARAKTSSATASFEESEKGAAATATTAGLTEILHRGQVEGRTEGCVPEPAIFACNILQ